MSEPEPPQPRPRTARYWLRLAGLFVFALIAALVFTPFAFGALMMWGLTHPPCNIGSPPSQPHEAVTFPSTRGVTQRGYFVPGTNNTGATVIVVPAYNNGRGAENYFVTVLNNAGFNVLTFDSRVCAGYGQLTLGFVEIEDVEAAYAYLLSRDDVDAGRISLHGFSSGGATALMAAGQLPEIRGVAAMGGYEDFAYGSLGVGQDGTYFDTLFRVGQVVMYRLVTGEDIFNLSPISSIPFVAPRPILLIYGTGDPALGGARQMQQIAADAGSDAELWVVEGAGHGGYWVVAREEFERRVVAFHQRVMSDEV